MLAKPDTAAAPFRVATRIADIGVSEILQIGAHAAALRKAGEDVIVLGAGEPDFDTPEPVKQAAVRAMQRGETKYTTLDGSPAMKEAVREKFRRDNRLEFSTQEISVAAGAKQVIFNAFMATLDPGDEVIVPTPYWTSYADIIRVAGGTPVLVACDVANGFRLTAEQLERAITPATRWLMLNSPSNPTGAAYSEADYRPLLDVLLRHPHVWLLADDIYEHIIYDDFRFVTPAALEPALRGRILTVNGVSKAYAMTGWRIGYGAGPAALIKAMAVIQSQSTSNPSSVSQAAAIEALTGSQASLTERRDSFRIRRDLVVDALNAMDGIDCPRPQGAFYTFASCAGLLGRMTPQGRRLESDRDFCAYILDMAKVAVVPGSAFGASPFFRISYATSEVELKEALARIAGACAALTR